METDTTEHERSVPRSLNLRVCLALAEAENVHPWDSTPLYETIDPNVLEALDEQDNDTWRLEFEAESRTVVVTGDGEVAVDDVNFTDRDFREAVDSLD